MTSDSWAGTASGPDTGAAGTAPEAVGTRVPTASGTVDGQVPTASALVRAGVPGVPSRPGAAVSVECALAHDASPRRRNAKGEHGGHQQ
ncbi:hypothetical protein [Brevibacterium luteolum]|uniref:hypothetical protein n=1 Tax=Brevibacterium luteolum TaxID=199591 RepID=UPI001C23BF65|nr:hypothetical protein [Brevibacterium luteolum]MBU8578771.1 hypothetical protein [Brevibacterium luteolum]